MLYFNRFLKIFRNIVMHYIISKHINNVEFFFCKLSSLELLFRIWQEKKLSLCAGKKFIIKTYKWPSIGVKLYYTETKFANKYFVPETLLWMRRGRPDTNSKSSAINDIKFA